MAPNAGELDALGRFSLSQILKFQPERPINWQFRTAKSKNAHKIMITIKMVQMSLIPRIGMRTKIAIFRFWGRWSVVLILAFAVVNSHTNGIDGNGTGARSLAMGGADVAWANDPLGAMAVNPAGLGFLDSPEVNLGVDAGLLDGQFNKPGVSSGNLDSSLRAFPEGAIAYPFKTWPVTVGLSVTPDSLLVADWHYLDPPGGLNGTTSYGYQEDRSEILLLRSALGASVKINSKLSFGASAGLLYNKNELATPYIFQNLSPASDQKFDGAKTLLNLQTSGLGWDVMAGLLFQATSNLDFGVSYKSASIVNTTGSATGDPYAQFGVPPGLLAFHYNADVKNKFPQEVNAGASWKFFPKWRGALQVDWIGWSDAFNSLPISLSGGSNSKVNGVLGSSFNDDVPLNWSDEFVYRVGLEYDVTDRLALRAGYAYGRSPVPDSTLTPMTAAIMEHTFTAGVGYHWRWLQVDLAYQYALPATQNVGASQLRSGEYSNSSTEVSGHVIALTAGISF
jgi:long-chain fatty acid transport protein